MSLGAGFEYLMSSVARGDGAAPNSQALTRYYLESGTPAGRFLGTGLAGLGGGAGLLSGTEVSEEALWRLLGMMADPVTGEPLGRAPQRTPVPLRQRIAARVSELPASLSAADRTEAAAAISTEEDRRQDRMGRAVAGFDLTLSVPKSVSVLWALADADTQAAIHRAHRDAIDVVLAWAEQNIAFTRTGAGGRVQVPVRGLVAAAFDHWDSRAGDPHLHTHLVVANRVQAEDGTWRSLDGATLFRYTVALSELHEGVLHDLLTDRLGVGWTTHPRRHSPTPRWDIAGVGSELLEEFSARSQAINGCKDELVEAFVAEHGRHPSNVETLKLRQRATLQTRPGKTKHSLAEQMAGWRARAAEHTPGEPPALRDLPAVDVPALVGGSVDGAMLDALGRAALAEVSARRAVFGEANLLAEVHRQLHGARFATPADRLAVAARIVEHALDQAVSLAAPDQAATLHRGTPRFTTAAILDAETRLLDTGRDLTGPAAAPDPIDESALARDQRAAVTAIATSGRVLDVLVGPAGSGKTTSLSVLKQAWEAAHGPGSVAGLAPSAAAAQVLADELGIATDNTAKWLHEQQHRYERMDRTADLTTRMAASRNPGSVWSRRLETERLRLQAELDRWTLRAGQLLIIDEATLAGTLTLDTIASAAREAGGKVLLVGDWAQLGAIEAGGTFHMLATDRTDTPQLTDVHRFTEPWEAAASFRLRTGDRSALDDYLAHGRVHSGETSDMLHALFDAWHTDTQAGLDSIMIAPDESSVRDLNALAQAQRRDAGKTGERTVPIAAGERAGVGDRIVTRRNDRRLLVDDRSRWVQNGDQWTVTEIQSDGSLTAVNAQQRSVVLPPDYATSHVELGYATTVHRSQGRTVDTAHALITELATRESLYVAATRARNGNHLYVTNGEAPEHDDFAVGDLSDSSRAVLTDVLGRTATETSAHAHARSASPEPAQGQVLSHRDEFAGVAVAVRDQQIGL